MSTQRPQSTADSSNEATLREVEQEGSVGSENATGEKETAPSVNNPPAGPRTPNSEKDTKLELDEDVATGHPEANYLDDEYWASSPENPWNWSTRRKWRQAGIVSAYTFMSPLASSMLAPALPDIAAKFHITNQTVIAMPLCIFILAYAIGPLIMSPLSEMYGRRWVLNFSNISFLAWNLVCAWAPNTAALIVFRFMAGLGGGTPIAIGGSVISDAFPPRDRAAAMAIYTMGPLMGPVIGPIAGGFIAETIGFKWVFIIITIAAGLSAIIGIPLLEETYHPVLRARLAVKVSGDLEMAAKIKAAALQGRTPGQVLWLNLSRPMVMFFRSLILFVLSVFMAIQYGFLYLMFATFPTLFPEVYGFSTGITGLCYLGLGVGFFGATVLGATTSNKIYLRLADKKNGGVGKAEYRIPPMLVGGLLVPIGLFWYGWSSQARIHWIMPIIGSGIFGAGMMTTFLPIQLYIVDSFNYVASALAAASVIRALFGFGFPLFAEDMFIALGNGPGYSLLGGLAIVVGLPFPVWLYFYGEELRAKSTLTR